MDRTFFTWFMATTLVIVLLLVGVARLMDPFGQFASSYTPFPHTSDPVARAAYETPYTLNRALFKVINFKRFAAAAADADRPVNVILGDSIANQLDPGGFAARDGKHWFSVAYGTASIDENMILLVRLIEDYKVDAVLWVLPFTRLGIAEKNRMTKALADAAHPWRHLFSFETLRAVVYTLRQKWLGVAYRDPVNPHGIDEIVAYELSRFVTDRAGQPWSDAQFRQLDAAITQAEAAGARVIIVVPPLHPELQRLFATAMPREHARYHAFLAEHCTIDLAAIGEERWPANMFRDTVHFTGEHRPALTTALLDALDDACRDRRPDGLLPVISRRY
jgi:hypothetical protein